MKFNNTNSTENYAGGEAYEPAYEELKLYKIVINNLLEDTYYQGDETAFDEIIQVSKEVDPEYLCKLAAYARQEHGLRQVPQMLLALAAGRENNSPVREYAPAVISRADEPMEVLAAWKMIYGPITVSNRAEAYLEEYGNHLNSKEKREVERLRDGKLDNPEFPQLVKAVKTQGRAIPNPLQDGIEEALHNFDEYQFAKYDSNRREWDMKDVLNVVRPNPRDELREECFRKIIRGEMTDYSEEYLETPTTWETVISERGNTREAWTEVLPRMGLFAKIRNLRNLAEHGFSATDIFDQGDIEYAGNSKMYPFRFYQAHLAMERSEHDMENIDRVLEKFIHNTVDNVQFDNTLVCVDISGSMSATLSQQSVMTYEEISSFLGAVMSYHQNDVLSFASDVEHIRFRRSEQIFDRIDKIRSVRVGGSTNGWKAIDWESDHFKTHDRIVMLTDMQIWDSTGWGRFGSQKTVKGRYDDLDEKPALYMVDLSSYGHLVAPTEYEHVYNVNGWNEKILDFINAAEHPNPVNEVKEYEA